MMTYEEFFALYAGEPVLLCIGSVELIANATPERVAAKFACKAGVPVLIADHEFISASGHHDFARVFTSPDGDHVVCYLTK